MVRKDVREEWDERHKKYFENAKKEGKSRKQIGRDLKRKKPEKDAAKRIAVGLAIAGAGVIAAAMLTEVGRAFVRGLFGL